LVERQLCKLEVRGSNPLASKTEGVEAKYNKRERYRMHQRERNPLPPVFARVIEKSEGCRAEASAKADCWNVISERSSVIRNTVGTA
jgi:hypothetical protein